MVVTPPSNAARLMLPPNDSDSAAEIAVTGADLGSTELSPSGTEVLEAHPSGDPTLTALSLVDGLVADLVRAYPGRGGLNSSPRWLEDWFYRRTESRFVGEEQPPSDAPSAESIAALMSADARGVRPATIRSVEPRYFRGFRVLAEPIVFSRGLTVIDGKNSSGKTSLAEALEWLFTGGLVRRSMKDLGNARELANCVGNQFRPAGEETWVEVVFDTADGPLALRRLLVEDYGVTSTAPCTSRLFADGIELNAAAEAALLDELFAGSAPLLMQHTLRLFVHSDPADRRRYFERLLRLDELTQLIEKAVIGAPRLVEFPSPSGSLALRCWEGLKRGLQNSRSKSAARRIEKASLEEIPGGLEELLPSIAMSEFGRLVPGGSTLAAAEARVRKAQRSVREASFPLLDLLRPKRAVDDAVMAQLRRTALEERLATGREALQMLAHVRKAATKITEAQIAIAQATSQLEAAGLIPGSRAAVNVGARAEGAGNAVDADAIPCPLCEFGETPTLTRARLDQIRAWQPAREALRLAEQKVDAAAAALLAELRQLVDVRKKLVPALPAEEQWTAAVANAPEPMASAARSFREVHEQVSTRIAEFDRAIAAVGRALPGSSARLPTVASTVMDAAMGEDAVPPSGTGPEFDHDLERALSEQARNVAVVLTSVDEVVEHAQEYAAALASLEAAVGTQAKEDAGYRLREDWLAVASDITAVARDLAWERAKVQTQADLAAAREALIVVRQELLDQRRQDFNDGMTRVWGTLRADRYSAFSHLLIPPPRGRGFPIEIEVKARLDDNVQTKEVDALRVFSESQVHALGVAAFVTRCGMLGHRFIVLDDPVQSMDEEHFLTFATKLIPLLLDDGFQVVILTHNETFARDVSIAHLDRVDYATVEIQHSRRKGCRIERDNRRVRERLRRAKRVADDGDLKDAWLLLRLAIERLYTVAYVKHGPSTFRPASWTGITAEAMYEHVGTILEAALPGCGARLKQILVMTAAGAHDKAARGATDVINAAKDIEDVAASLRIVD